MKAQEHIFTLEQAESLLPQVAPLMKSLQTLKRQLDGKIASWESQVSSGPVSLPEEILARSQAKFLVAQMNDLLSQVQIMGCFPKDLDMGLVDFPAQENGRARYLCWKLGESHIGYWHDISEGFDGRKPL